MKWICRIAGLAAVLAFLAGCENLPDETFVTVSLDKELISNLPVGEEQTLVAEVQPEIGDLLLVWSSDNEEVATVSAEGVVKGIAPGEAQITVSVGQSSASCKVVVTAVKVTEIALDKAEIELVPEGTYQLAVVLTPSNAVADDLDWSSDNADVATVVDGLVTAHAIGNAVITVKCNDGALSASCQVSVVSGEKIAVTGIELMEEMALSTGGSMTLLWTVLPEDASDKTLTFSVKEGDCVNVDKNGTVTALKEGQATIMVTANDGSGVTAECKVTVTKDTSVKTVYIKGPDDLQVGTSIQLEAEFGPVDATPVSVAWTIDNSEYAEVTQTGVLTGLSAYYDENRKAWETVNVKLTADGISYEKEIRVIPRQADGILFDLPERNLKVFEQWDLNPRMTPEGLPYSIYHSLLDDGVHIDGDVISCEQPGTYKIHYSVSEDHLDVVYCPISTIYVTVDPYWVESVSIDATLELETGSTTTLTPVFTSDVNGIAPTYKDVKWVSSDESVVKVDSRGNVSAIAAGTAVVTVTTSSKWSVPEGSEQKYASCHVSVVAAENPVYVGDYFYSDGTWSTELQGDKTVVGVVFATANATSTDPMLKNDYPECTHGLVMSVTEYESAIVMSGSNYTWREVYDYAVEQGGYADMKDTEIICGYSNTLAMKSFKVAQGEYSLYLDKLAEQEAVAITGASAWYIPSMYEMSLISRNFTTVNDVLTAAGKTPLELFASSWTGSEYKGTYWHSTWGGDKISAPAWVFSEDRTAGNMQMEYVYPVRFVFAF